MKHAVHIILMGLIIAACVFMLHSKPAHAIFALTDISGHLPNLEFSLTDDQGKKVTANDYRGEVVLLYFGFSGCSSQCPLTMSRLTALLQNSPHAHVLFASVNPDGDTPPILHRYLAAFDARHMSGLTGNESAIEALAKRYRAAYRTANGGDIAHSNLVYIFDKQGRARLLASPEDSGENIAHDLRQLTYE